MWIDKHTDKTSEYNRTNFNFGKAHSFIYDNIWLNTLETKRLAHRKTPISWKGKRTNKIYTLKTAKTSEMLKKISVLKTKGVHKYKKYMYPKYKINTMFFESVWLLGGLKEIKKIKIDVDNIFLSENSYLDYESETSLLSKNIDKGDDNIKEVLDTSNTVIFFESLSTEKSVYTNNSIYFQVPSIIDSYNDDDDDMEFGDELSDEDHTTYFI